MQENNLRKNGKSYLPIYNNQVGGLISADGTGGCMERCTLKSRDGKLNLLQLSFCG